jgi:branched-chain amino acid transport system substrate-binding protein
MLASMESAASVPELGDVVKVGILLPFDGKYTEPATRVREGIEMGLAHSTDTVPTEILLADDRGDERVAASEYNRLVDQGVSVVFGPLLLKTTQSVSTEAKNRKVPFLSFTKSQGIVDGQMLRLGVTSRDQAVDLAEFARRSLQLQRVAVVFSDSESGRELAREFEREFKRVGGTVAYSSAFSRNDQKSVADVTQGVVNANVDGVFLPDSVESVLPVMESVRASAGNSLVFLGTALWDDPIVRQAYGGVLEGAVYVTPFVSSSRRPQVTDFVSAYRARFGKDPDLLAAQAFDAATVISASLQAARQSGQKKFEKSAITSIGSRDGVTGKLSADASGEIGRRMSVVRVSRGEAIEVMAGGTMLAELPPSASPAGTALEADQPTIEGLGVEPEDR